MARRRGRAEAMNEHQECTSQKTCGREGFKSQEERLALAFALRPKDAAFRFDSEATHAWVDLKSSARVTAQYAAPQVKVSKMKIERFFRVAPSIVRMILKEHLTATYVVEGYLRSTPERTQLVRLEPNGCHLLLQRLGDQKRTEERTKLPTDQAEALLDVSGGRVGYRRTLV